MKRCLVVLAFVVCGAFSGITTRAQALVETQSKVPLMRCAPLFGRGGTAFGETGYCEANPASWFGVGVLAGRSGIRGYQDQGATANMHDFSSGLVLVIRYPKEIKRFRFGVFVQAAYNGSHVKATYQDSYVDQNGNTVQVMGSYRQSDRDPVTTLGANIEYRVPHGPWMLFRVGKNLGDGLSSTTAGGFYVSAGPMVDPLAITKSVGHLFKH
jgi:hypothetical protein